MITQKLFGGPTSPSLDHDSYTWKSSTLVPYMSHLMFQLYDCGKERAEHEPRYFVKLIFNEKEISIAPHFPVNCPYAGFWNHYKDHLKESFTTICDRYTAEKRQREHGNVANNNNRTNHKPVLSPPTIVEQESYSFIEGYVILIFISGLFVGLFSKPVLVVCKKYFVGDQIKIK